ncbi:hypothetical protein QJQ45_002957 [Haematococcus lacustris]|nr:hypothetical protein QJQ45_002957 [Haematococcus lacustris]
MKNKKSCPLAARIKKLMQADEDVGKIAQATPVMMGTRSILVGPGHVRPVTGFASYVAARALELFLKRLCEKTIEVAQSRQAKTLSCSHLKHLVSTEATMDFLKDIVASAPDLAPEAEVKPVKRRRSCNTSKASRGGMSGSGELDDGAEGGGAGGEEEGTAVTTPRRKRPSGGRSSLQGEAGSQEGRAGAEGGSDSDSGAERGAAGPVSGDDSDMGGGCKGRGGRGKRRAAGPRQPRQRKAAAGKVEGGGEGQGELGSPRGRSRGRGGRGGRGSAATAAVCAEQDQGVAVKPDPGALLAAGSDPVACDALASPQLPSPAAPGWVSERASGASGGKPGGLGPGASSSPAWFKVEVKEEEKAAVMQLLGSSLGQGADSLLAGADFGAALAAAAAAAAAAVSPAGGRQPWADASGAGSVVVGGQQGVPSPRDGPAAAAAAVMSAGSQGQLLESSSMGLTSFEAGRAAGVGTLAAGAEGPGHTGPQLVTLPSQTSHTGQGQVTHPSAASFVLDPTRAAAAAAAPPGAGGAGGGVPASLPEMLPPAASSCGPALSCPGVLEQAGGVPASALSSLLSRTADPAAAAAVTAASPTLQMTASVNSAAGLIPQHSISDVAAAAAAAAQLVRDWAAAAVLAAGDSNSAACAGVSPAPLRSPSASALTRPSCAKATATNSAASVAAAAPAIKPTASSSLRCSHPLSLRPQHPLALRKGKSHSSLPSPTASKATAITPSLAAAPAGPSQAVSALPPALTLPPSPAPTSSPVAALGRRSGSAAGSPPPDMAGATPSCSGRPPAETQEPPQGPSEPELGSLVGAGAQGCPGPLPAPGVGVGKAGAGTEPAGQVPGGGSGSGPSAALPSPPSALPASGSVGAAGPGPGPALGTAAVPLPGLQALPVLHHLVLLAGSGAVGPLQDEDDYDS